MATKWEMKKQLNFVSKNTCNDVEPLIGSLDAMFKGNYTKTERLIRLHGTDIRSEPEKTLMRTMRGNMILGLIQSEISAKTF